jgi:Sec-independent protein translocase protein TatA
VFEQKNLDADRLKTVISEMQKQIEGFKPALKSASNTEIQSIKQQTNRQFE